MLCLIHVYKAFVKSEETTKKQKVENENKWDE